jgi:hypothetical protein
LQQQHTEPLQELPYQRQSNHISPFYAPAASPPIQTFVQDKKSPSIQPPTPEIHANKNKPSHLALYLSSIVYIFERGRAREAKDAFLFIGSDLTKNGRQEDTVAKAAMYT